MTSQDAYTRLAKTYLHDLCVTIGARPTGSAANRRAQDYVAAAFTRIGYTPQYQSFTCLDWTQDGARLAVGGEAFAALVSPYSLGCNVCAPLAVVSSIEELEAADIDGKIVLVRGDLAREQLMPKNFPFYNPAEHKRVIDALEAKCPQAIVAATSRDAGVAGAIYPFPLIEDGDFDIPSVYMTEDEGARLAHFAGALATLEIAAQRRPSTACNVIAQQAGNSQRKVVVCAHLDSKVSTPGALDNAAGIATLLLLADLLSSHNGRLGIEFVAINGEDYYASSGEVRYLESNHAKLGDIALAINMDGLGYRVGKAAFSLYECPDSLAHTVRSTLARHDALLEGEQWYQGDHMIFALNQRPALAITSAQMTELWSTIAHTSADTPDLVDASSLIAVASALHALILEMEKEL